MKARLSTLGASIAFALAYAGNSTAGIVVVNSSEDLRTDSVEAKMEEDTGGDKCPLRWAVQAALEDERVGGCPGGNGADTLEFTVSTIRLTLGEIEIDSELSINGGPGRVTLSGNKSSRIFNVTADNMPVQVAGIIFREGHTSGEGACVLATGSTILKVEDSTFENCLARGSGGALSSEGSLEVKNSEFVGNASLGTLTNGKLDGGGGQGGAISAGFEAKIEATTFDGNSAAFGGGAMDCSNGKLELFANHFVRNYAMGHLVNGNPSTNGGGALQTECTTSSAGNLYERNYSYGRGGGAILVGAGASYAWLRQDVLRGNEAAPLPLTKGATPYKYGGGILTFSRTMIDASVLQDNVTRRGLGGGLASLGQSDDRRVTLVNSEVVFNEASFEFQGLSGPLAGAGVYAGPAAAVTLHGTTVAWNKGSDQLHTDPTGFLSQGGITAINTLVAAQQGQNSATCGGELQKFTGFSNRQADGSEAGPTDCPANVYKPANPYVGRAIATWGQSAGKSSVCRFSSISSRRAVRVSRAKAMRPAATACPSTRSSSTTRTCWATHGRLPAASAP